MSNKIIFPAKLDAQISRSISISALGSIIGCEIVG